LLLAGTPIVSSQNVGCYPAAGEGVDPPAFSFYFPVGLAVSKGGNVLYAVNSDFDLQWNGGTIQSLDLRLIRRHTVMAIKDPTDPNLPLAIVPDGGVNNCPNGPPVITTFNDAGVEPGWACSPPTNAARYMRDSIAIGAFATDAQVSIVHRPDDATKSRLFVPVRGDASLTWADVVDDDPNVAPLESDTPDTYTPFNLDCGARDVHRRCARNHSVGNDATQQGDTRLLTMPGEPFGMAQSDDGQAIVITHQSDQFSSLFSTFTPNLVAPDAVDPALQYVLQGVPTGGIGIAAIPHDLDAFPQCVANPADPSCLALIPRPAFLQTSRASGLVALVRFYDDIGSQGPSTLFRPFIQNEADYGLNVNAGTTDFARGIAIDPSPRIRCKAKLGASPAPADLVACAQLPARVFVASRGPNSLIIGEVGEPITQGGSYAPDFAVFNTTFPLDPGPSAVKMGAIVDKNGNLALRVFIVLFDSNEIIDYDPDQGQIEAIIPVGLGPFAIAFDPFDFTAAALGQHVATDPNDNIKKYRFAYVASFTQSYMQVIDLDNSTPDKSTWATVVYTVGVPTSPKGS
jgi:hypothetical protein